MKRVILILLFYCFEDVLVEGVILNESLGDTYTIKLSLLPELQSVITDLVTANSVDDPPIACRKDYCQNSTKTDFDYGVFDWPATQVGNQRLIRCPYAYDVPIYASRICLLTRVNSTTWSDPDIEDCPLSPFTIKLREINHITQTKYEKRGNNTDTCYEVRDDMEQLMNIYQTYPDHPTLNQQVYMLYSILTTWLSMCNGITIQQTTIVTIFNITDLIIDNKFRLALSYEEILTLVDKLVSFVAQRLFPADWTFAGSNAFYTTYVLVRRQTTTVEWTKNEITSVELASTVNTGSGTTHYSVFIMRNSETLSYDAHLQFNDVSFATPSPPYMMDVDDEQLTAIVRNSSTTSLPLESPSTKSLHQDRDSNKQTGASTARSTTKPFGFFQPLKKPASGRKTRLNTGEEEYPDDSSFNQSDTFGGLEGVELEPLDSFNVHPSVNNTRTRPSHGELSITGPVIYLDGTSALVDKAHHILYTIKYPIFVEIDGMVCARHYEESDLSATTWSTAGCVLLPMTENDSVTCNCTASKGFYAVFAPRVSYPGLCAGDKCSNGKASAVDEFLRFPYVWELYIVTQVLRPTSVVCLILTILSFFLFRKARNGIPTKLLMNLCISLITLSVILYLAESLPKHRMECRIINALRYYLIMVSLYWSAAEAYNLYQMLIKVFNTQKTRFITKAAAVAWGVPVIQVAIVLGVDYTNFDGYFEKCIFRCSLKENTMYFAFLLPMCLIILHNLVVYIFVVRILVVRSQAKGNRSHYLRKLFGAISLLFLLGIPWIFTVFGAMDTGSDSTLKLVQGIFQAVFVVTYNIQGIFVFCFRCLRNKTVRSEWASTFKRIREGSLTSSLKLTSSSKASKYVTSATTELDKDTSKSVQMK